MYSRYIIIIQLMRAVTHINKRSTKCIPKPYMYSYSTHVRALKEARSK